MAIDNIQVSIKHHEHELQQHGDAERRRDAATGTITYITSSTATATSTDNCRRSIVVIVAAVRTLGNTSATDAEQ